MTLAPATVLSSLDSSFLLSAGSPTPSHLDSHLQGAGVPRKANHQSRIDLSKGTTAQGSAGRQVGSEWVTGFGEGPPCPPDCPPYAQLSLSEGLSSPHHGMSPSTNSARVTVTRPEPGQKRGQVWGKGVGWESVLSLPLGPCRHPGAEATPAPKESYPKVPTIPELGMTADFGQVTFPLGASLTFIFSTQGV